MTLKVGIVGCGNISSIYLENNRRFSEYDIVACTDLDESKAKTAALKYGIKHVLSVEEMITLPEIDIILNLTIPKAHATVSLQGIDKKKHIYSEKPIAISFEDGKRIIENARLNNVMVGSAPDTFLGSSIQLAHQLIEDGAIGKIVGGSAFMMSRGPESWHPNPEFFYQVGGGPMYDMGPYYLTALVSLLGPVSRLTGLNRTTYPERVITNAEKYGQKIEVQVPTHVNGILKFANGEVVTITNSFDVSAARTPFIEIYGEEGTISLPDPNYFNQPLLMRKHGENDWTTMNISENVNDNLRGIGLADMARAIVSGHKPRANGEMALHVLEIMHGIHQSSDFGSHYVMETTCERPAILEKEYMNY